jgi:hypothetical protein
MLPAEVQLCVLRLLGVEDLYRLGLTCRYFWSTVQPQIRKSFSRRLGVWAGTPVVCIGEYSSTDQDAYPQGLLNRHTKRELKKGLPTLELGDSEGEQDVEHISSGPITLYQLAEHRYRARHPVAYEEFSGNLLPWIWEQHCYKKPSEPPGAILVARPTPGSSITRTAYGSCAI